MNAMQLTITVFWILMLYLLKRSYNCAGSCFFFKKKSCFLSYELKWMASFLKHLSLKKKYLKLMLRFCLRRAAFVKCVSCSIYVGLLKLSSCRSVRDSSLTWSVSVMCSSFSVLHSVLTIPIQIRSTEISEGIFRVVLKLCIQKFKDYINAVLTMFV